MMRELRRCSLEEIEADLCSDPSEDDFATERPGRQSADPAKLFVRSWQRHVAPKLDCLLDQLEQDALASSLALVQVWTYLAVLTEDGKSLRVLDRAYLGDPVLAGFHRSCLRQGVAVGSLGPMGRVWESGAVQVAQAVSGLPEGEHPSRSLPPPLCSSVGEVVYMPVYERSGSVSQGVVAVLELLLRPSCADGMAVATAISGVARLMEGAGLGLQSGAGGGGGGKCGGALEPSSPCAADLCAPARGAPRPPCASRRSSEASESTAAGHGSQAGPGLGASAGGLSAEPLGPCDSTRRSAEPMEGLSGAEESSYLLAQPCAGPDASQSLHLSCCECCSFRGSDSLGGGSSARVDSAAASCAALCSPRRSGSLVELATPVKPAPLPGRSGLLDADPCELEDARGGWREADLEAGEDDPSDGDTLSGLGPERARRGREDARLERRRSSLRLESLGSGLLRTRSVHLFSS